MTYRKELVEVAPPLDANSREAEPGQSDTGTTLHLWWARRPLAAFEVTGGKCESRYGGHQEPGPKMFHEEQDSVG